MFLRNMITSEWFFTYLQNSTDKSGFFIACKFDLRQNESFSVVVSKAEDNFYSGKIRECREETSVSRDTSLSKMHMRGFPSEKVT